MLWQSLKDAPERLSNTSESQKQIQEHSFKNVVYYHLKGVHKNAFLKASTLDAGKYKVAALNPVGDVFDSKGKKLNFSGRAATYIKKSQIVEIKDDVSIFHDQINVKCHKAKLSIKKQFSNCRGDVRANITKLKNGDRLKIESSLLNMWLARKNFSFHGNVKGRLKRRYSYEPGVRFSSKTLSVVNDELKAELEGNVKIHYEGISSRSQRAEIFLENYNKKLKYYVLYDDIEIEQKIQSQDGKSFIRKAYSEIVEAFNLERKIVLKGAPKVSQGSDMTRGYKITLFLDREIMEVENSSSVISIKQ